MRWKLGGTGLAALLIAAAIGLPVDEWAKPLLWMVAVAGALAVLFRATSLAAAALSIGIGLVAFITGYSWLSRTLREALSTREVLFVLGGLALGAVLLGASKLGRLFQSGERAVRPTRTRRAPVIEPEEDAPWSTSVDEHDDDEEDEIAVFRPRGGRRVRRD